MDRAPEAVLVKFAAETRNLFSVFDKYVNSFRLKHFSDKQQKLYEKVIVAELRKRLKSNTIDMASFDTVDESGWRLVDRVTLRYPKNFKQVARILIESGLRTNFPLHLAYYLNDINGLRALIASRNVDYNEDPSHSSNILTL